jgi:hypothetical protein
MSPLRALTFFTLAGAAFAQLSCSSSTKTTTSGGGHFEIQSDPAVTDPTLKCDDVGKQVTISVKDASGVDKLIVDGSDGATVSCSFDSGKFNITVGNAAGTISASGTIQSGTSNDAHVSLFFLGSQYNTPSAAHCTVSFVCGDPKNCPSGNSIEGHFLCDEIDNSSTAKECSVKGANPAGLSNSYFKFNDCN